MPIGFYILEKNETIGPFSIVELRNQNIKRSTLLWTEGMEGWQKASEIPELGELTSTLPPEVPEMPDTFLIQSILATLFCCLPAGAVGIYYASKVATEFREGNLCEAAKYSDYARDLCRFSFYSFLTLILLTLVVGGTILLSDYQTQLKVF